MKSLSNIVIEVRASNTKQNDSSLSLSLSNSNLLDSSIEKKLDVSYKDHNDDRGMQVKSDERFLNMSDSKHSKAAAGKISSNHDNHVFGDLVGQIFVIMEVTFSVTITINDSLITNFVIINM